LQRTGVRFGDDCEPEVEGGGRVRHRTEPATDHHEQAVVVGQSGMVRNRTEPTGNLSTMSVSQVSQSTWI